MSAENTYFDVFFRELGAELRDRRKRLGYTQEDMIDFGFSARHWQQIEAGRSITVKTLLKACSSFDVKASTVLRAVENKLASGTRTPASRKGRKQ